MARGITQDQVNAAADAILGAGENLTLEKVRAELGTGSPNTVTRMLDAWRSQLGERLRQLSALSDVPAPVGQAMVTLWQLATEHASQAIGGRFAEERAALETDRNMLAAERRNGPPAWRRRRPIALGPKPPRISPSMPAPPWMPNCRTAMPFGRISLSSGTGCNCNVTNEPAESKRCEGS